MAEEPRFVKKPKDRPEAQVSYLAANGDLAPYVKKGGMVYMTREMPEVGQFGLFLHEGRVIARQFCQDSQGTVYLFSLDRRRPDDVVIPKSVPRPVCFGTILLPEDIPLPNR